MATAGVAPQSVTPITTVAPDSPVTVLDPVSDQLIAEVKTFGQDCRHRYEFNNRWDIVLSVVGILLSIAIVAAGFSGQPMLSALLGAIVGAVVTAQKAFPFGQRASFYRLLIGQTGNLTTRATHGLLGKKEVVDILSRLRMDFAQQLPRGSSSEAKDEKVPPSTTDPAPPADTTTQNP